MSPRSEEFRDLARRKLAVARSLLDSGFSQDAAGAAYYAMLCAARAALSEEDDYAKTHSGTWTLFSKHFVKPGGFDRSLARSARDAEQWRLQADYGAAGANPEEAAATIEHAERFLEAIDRLYP